MSRLWARIAGIFGSRTLVGVDKAGNNYFSRIDEIDGVTKEKRWVIFKGDVDSTSLPVEWICWLNGQRKKAPTPEEILELEASRERVKLNVARLKKEEEEKRAKDAIRPTVPRADKAAGPDLKSFVRHFPAASKGEGGGETSDATDGPRTTEGAEAAKHDPIQHEQQPESSEPTGSGESFRPGTWQPPT